MLTAVCTCSSTGDVCNALSGLSVGRSQDAVFEALASYANKIHSISKGQGGGHGWWDERANVESVIGEQEGVGGYELMQPNDVTIEYCSAGRRVGEGEQAASRVFMRGS